MQERTETVLKKALDRETLNKDEILYLLSLKNREQIERLFQTARTIKERNFGNKVFIYGFIYFSTYCRNECSFCFYRRSNGESVRYRKTREDIISLATSLEDAGVHLVDLTMGEDPQIHVAKDWNVLLEVVQTVNDSVKVPIMVSPGVLPKEIFPSLRDAGADWFACYQETHNRKLYSKLRPAQDYDTRLNTKMWAHRAGILTEEGIMVGVGETLSDRADSIQVIDRLGVQQVRAMTFVPQKNTPMETLSPTPYMDELITIAVMRLVHQDKLIPASLDIEGAKGLTPRLDAGANVITSIVPPKKGLAGVAQHELDIDNGERSAENVEEMLEDIGAKAATPSEYKNFVDSCKRNIMSEGGAK